MLTGVSSLLGSKLTGRGRPLGRLTELMFDNSHLVVRYLIVDVLALGLPLKRVAVSPVSVERLAVTAGEIAVGLPRSRVLASPRISRSGTISRRKERLIHARYRLPVYWGGSGLWGNGQTPAVLTGAAITRAIGRRGEEDEFRLHRTQDVLGCSVFGMNGLMGSITDWVVEIPTWELQSVVVTAPSDGEVKTVQIPVEKLREFKPGDASVRLAMKVQRVKSLRRFDERVLAEQQARGL